MAERKFQQTNSSHTESAHRRKMTLVNMTKVHCLQDAITSIAEYALIL